MLKRAFDIVASLVSLISLSPIFIVVSVIIKFTSPGTIFYRANRVGLDGETFQLFKFRSMVMNADQIGPGITGASDTRVTTIGRFLRKTKLDELPQILNVLRGEMSIVGPRPEDPRYVAYYTDKQRQILNVRPGITSPASLRYRDEESFLTAENWEKYYIEQIMPQKLALDLEYLHNASLWHDVKVILNTLHALFIYRSGS